MPTVADICVDIRNNFRTRISRVPDHDLVGLQIVKRFNNVGYWELTINNASPIVSDLREPGNGIVVQLYNQIIFSGNVTSVTRIQSQDDPSGLWRIQGVDDNQYLQDYLAWPAAPNDDVTNQDQSWYLRSGIVSTLMYNLVNENIGDLAGASRALGLTMAPDPEVGGEGYLSTKWDTLGHALSRCAYMATPNLRYEILQNTGTDLVFSIAEIQDHTNEYRFDIFNNQILRNEWTYTAPDATVAIVGGLSNGIDRIYYDATTDASTSAEAEWGRRIETFVDNKSDFDQAVLVAQGQAALQENGATKHGFSIVPNEDVPFYRFGTHFNLGDTVTVTIESNDVLQTITEYALSISSDGIRQTLGIGNVEVLQNIAGDAPQMTIVGRYAAKTQKLQNRIKALEQSFSNVANMKPLSIGPGVPAARGDSQYFWAMNDSDGTIEKGDLVYVTGDYGGFALVDLYGWDTAPVWDGVMQPIDGMATETLEVGEGGWICAHGRVTGIDTSDWLQGQLVFIGEYGWWTPYQTPEWTTVCIGTIMFDDATDGSIFFNPVYDVEKTVYTFEATISGSQSIPSGSTTYTIVGDSATAAQRWDVTYTADQFIMHTESNKRGQLEITQAGQYSIFCHVRWGSNTTGKRNLRIAKNLGVDEDIAAVATQAVDTTRQSLSRPSVWLDVGDIITVEVLQTSGSAQTLAPSATGPIQLYVEFLGNDYRY